MESKALSRIAVEALEARRNQLMQQIKEVEEAINWAIAQSGPAQLKLAIHSDAPVGNFKTKGEKPIKDYAIDVLKQHPEGLPTAELFRAISNRGARCKGRSSLYGILARYKDEIVRDRKLWKLAQKA